MNPKYARLVRFAGRFTALGIVACVLAVISMQFEGVVAKNFAIGHDISVTNADIDALRMREQHQRETIRRLGDPHGAIPEIHEKLHLVGPHEEIFYVRGAEQRAAAPEEGERSP